MLQDQSGSAAPSNSIASSSISVTKPPSSTMDPITNEQGTPSSGRMDEQLMGQSQADASGSPTAKAVEKDSSVRLFFFLLGSFFVIGLVQLLGYAGLGQRDPWVPGMTVLQVTAVIASGIQIVMFVPAYIWQTERYYDLTGTLTYLVCLAYSFAGGYEMSINRTGNPLDERAIIATCFVAVWTIRLGYFLFTRILHDKKDARFDELKPSFIKFFIVWNIQGLWIFLGCMPTFILNSTQTDAGFYWTDAVGGALFVLGFAGEVLADNQKKAFNSKPGNKGKWIDVGLWRYSRHPNYFCEWVLQFGLFVFCLSEFQSSQWVAVLSPIFIACLLMFISGVPLLEKRADEKWGGIAEYEEYKRATSTCLPLPRLPTERDVRESMCCLQNVLV